MDTIDSISRLREELRARAERGDALDVTSLMREHPELASAVLAWLTAAPSESDGEHGVAPKGVMRRMRLQPRGRYADFNVVGEGGQGYVYRATDTDLQRDVAFKALRMPGPQAPDSPPPSNPDGIPPPPSDSESQEALEQTLYRFLQEALITGGLAHPGVAPLFEIGRTQNGVPYYTMRFIEGETTLHTRVAEFGGESIEKRLSLLEPFLRVCDTIAFAHSKGVVHRDLKPANIAIGKYGDVIVLDWGLAAMRPGCAMSASYWHEAIQRMRVAGELGVTEGTVGTPGYIPPEAITNSSDDILESGDIYCLGIILFEILTGRRPFEFESVPEYALKVTRVDPPLAHEVDSTVPVDLSDLCARMLSRDPTDRPQSATEVAAAIRSWQSRTAVDQEVRSLLKEARIALMDASDLSGRSLLRQLDRASAPLVQIQRLRPDDAAAREELVRVRDLRERALAEQRSAAKQEMRKHVVESRRRLFRRAVTVASLLVAMVTVAALLYVAERRRDAEAAAVRARSAEGETRAHLGRALAQLAERFTDEGRHAAAHLAAAKALLTKDAGSSWAALAAAARFSYPTFETFSASVRIRSMAYDDGTSRLFAGCQDGHVRIWSLQTGRLEAVFRAHREPVTALTLSPDGRRLYSGGQGLGLVRVWDANRHKVLNTLMGFRGAVRDMAFLEEGDVLLALDAGLGGLDGTSHVPGGVQLWDLRMSEPVWHIDGIPGHVPTAFCASAAGDHLFVGSEGSIVVWSIERRLPVRAFQVTDGRITDLAVSRDDGVLYVATSSAAKATGVEVWDWRKGERRATTTPVPRGFDEIVLGPEGKTIYASRTGQARIHVWRFEEDEFVEHAVHLGRAPFLLTGADGRLVAADDDTSLNVYAPGSGQRLASLRTGHPVAIRAAVGSPDGRRILTQDREGEIRSWDTVHATHSVSSVRIPQATALAVPSVGWDFYAVAVGATLELVDATTGNRRPLTDLPASVHDLAFAPSASELLAGTEEGDVFAIGNLHAGVPTLRRITHFQGAVTALAVATDAKRLYVAGLTEGGTGELRGFDLEDRSVDAPAVFRATLPREGPAFLLSVDPQARHLASVGLTGRLELWDAQTAAPLHTIVAPWGHIHAVTLSRDGGRLYVASARLAEGTLPGGAGSRLNSVIRIWSLERQGISEVEAFFGESGLDVTALGVLEAHDSLIAALVPSASDTHLFSVGTEDREVLKWRTRGEGPALRVRSTSPEPVLTLAMAPGGQVLYSGHGTLSDACGSSDIVAWDVTGRRPSAVVQTGDEEPCCNLIDGRVLVISPAGDRLFSGAWSSQAAGPVPCAPPLPEEGAAPGGVGKPVSGEPVDPERVGAVAREGTAGRVLAHPLVKVLPLTGTADDLGEVAAGPPAHLYVDRADEYVLDLAVSGDGSHAYVAGRTGTVYEYDVRTLSLVRRFVDDDSPCAALALSPETVARSERRLFVGSRQGEIRIWSLDDTETPLHRMPAHDAGIGALLVSCDGRCLYSAAGTRGIRDEESRMLLGADTTIKQWDVAGRGLLREFSGHTEFITCLALREPYLFSGSLDGTIRIWDTRTGEQAALLDCHPARVRSIALSTDGKRLFAGTEQEGLLEWRLGYFLGDAETRVATIERETGLRLDHENLRIMRVLRNHLVARDPSAFSDAETVGER
ncbi:MAG: protein kinase domain-containing protein [Planctomycetota bacterium]